MDTVEKIEPSGRVLQRASRGERAYQAFALAVLLSSAPLMGLMFTAVAPVLPGVAGHFGNGADGAFIAQMIMTMPAVGIMLGGPTLGWIADRVGPRALLFGSLAGYSASGVCGFFLDDVWLVLASRFLLGLSVAGVGTSTMELISERYTGDQRARILGYQGAAGAFFGLATLLAAGAIGQAWGWRAPFGLYLSALVVLVIAMAVIPRSTHRVPGGSTREEIKALWALWPSYALIVACFIAVFMNAVQVSFVLAADGIISPRTQSLVLAANALANTTGAWSYGALHARLGPRTTFCLCLALMAAGYTIIGFSHDAVSIAIGSAVAGFGAGATGPHVFGLLLDRAPEELRGRAIGFLYTATYLGDFLNPWVVAPLRLAFGMHGAFLSMAVLLALGVLAVALRRSGNRPAAS